MIDSATVAAGERLRRAQPVVVKSKTGEVLNDAYFARLQEREARLADACIVRGRRMWDWREEIDNLKRTGQLEDALKLARECADAMEKYSQIDCEYSGSKTAGPAGWADRVAIILRKMKDYDGEVRYIEGVIDRYPRYANGKLGERLPKARQLRDTGKRT